MSGAVVERTRFGPFLIFAALWSVLVYSVLAHWAFGGGWLQANGTLDFAGGIPVEMGSGFSALTAALVVGARKDYGRQALLPHNAIYVLLGAGLLWFGWFGFNGGSGFAAGNASVLAAHGIAGLTGILFIGLVAQLDWNDISNGIVYGDAEQLGWQALAAIVTPVYAFGMTFVLLRLIGALTPLRVSTHEEAIGMDVTQHGEEAYVTGEGAILITPEDGELAPAPVVPAEAT